MKLTERDFEIIEFVLNMKFATPSDIHRKFFRVRKDGGISVSEWYARARLRELQLEGYLTTVRYRLENKSYYVGTKQGFKLLHYLKSADGISRPIEKIDVRTFDHDQRVM